MSSSVDRAAIEALLQDEDLSFREIARRTGASDWAVRAIDRKLRGDSAPMKSSLKKANDDDVEAFGELLDLLDRLQPDRVFDADDLVNRFFIVYEADVQLAPMLRELDQLCRDLADAIDREAAA